MGGAAAGAFNAARQLGSAIGVALFGTLTAASASSAFYTGMRLSAVVAAACFLGGPVLAALSRSAARSAPNPSANEAS
ncbi:hypothetical protein [Streptomyces malaysiensis]|uniref:hypothetical protein n=1 Tax=Streptomyces malaysiensis TaxID=92644 RepID=UPI003719680F